MRHVHRPFRRRLISVVLLALVTAQVVVACPRTAGAQASADAGPVLQRATATMAALKSFHFQLTTPRGKTLFMQNFELAGLSGDVQRPDRFRAAVIAKASIVELTVKVVGIGTKLWITDPTAQEERYVPVDLGDVTSGDGASIPDLLNPDRILLAAVDLIQRPTIAGQAKIDDVETTRIDGTFDLSRVQAGGTPISGLRTDRPLPVSIWIDEAGRVHRLEVSGPLTTAESSDVVRRLDLSAFDEPVDIQPPA